MKKIKSKSDITQEIIRLRDFGYIVLTFQNNKMGRSGIKGMTDYFIVGKSRMYFIEGKFGSDRLSNSQIELMHEIQKIESSTGKIVRHLLANENNVYGIVEAILNDNL